MRDHLTIYYIVSNWWILKHIKLPKKTTCEQRPFMGVLCVNGPNINSFGNTEVRS